MASDAARKADTYRKIQLGGLVIKAGMGTEDPAVILGALVDACERLASDPDSRARYKSLGDARFRTSQGSSRS